MPKTYKGKKIERRPEEIKLSFNINTQKIDLNDINPILLKNIFRTKKQLIGFNPETGLTRPRVVKNYEIVFFFESIGYSVINQRKYYISENDIRFHKPGDIVYSSQYGSLHIIHFALSSSSPQLYESDFLNYWPVFMPAYDVQEMLSKIENLSYAEKEKDIVFEKASLWDLFHYLNKNAKRFYHEKESQKSTNTVQSIKRYLKENFNKNITLADISELVYLHPNYVHRIFVKKTGITPLLYLRNIRLKKASEFLLTTDYNIQEISMACGFDNPSYFIRLFRREHEMSPSEFRNTNLINIEDIL